MALASIINSALITKVNKPKVKTFTGKVKTSKIGLIKVLIKPITTAVTMAGKKPSKCTPGNKYDNQLFI
jgi:hypothetical protein